MITKKIDSKRKTRLKALSLFANIGVAEAYLKDIGVDVAVANEFVEKRAGLYQAIYPDCDMICGDITDPKILNKIVKRAKEEKVDIVMATPPCQGMSTAGKQCEEDARNALIIPTVEVIRKLHPKYVFIENVPLFLQTSIQYSGNRINIPDFLCSILGEEYHINFNLLNTEDYGVPQSRERAITLMTRKHPKKTEWKAPRPNEKRTTLADAIGHLPKLDPFVKDVSEEELLELFPDFYKRKAKALKISKWHCPPVHIKRQVVAMQHTPTGKTAFDNPVYFPRKENGSPVRGYKNTYKRQNWDTPAYTITMDNRKISSQNNVHPGRLEYINSKGEEIYSDPRTLTTYELMLASSLPANWPVPLNTSEPLLRRLIGEGIPPLFVKRIFESLING